MIGKAFSFTTDFALTVPKGFLVLVSNPYQTEEEAAKLQFVRNHYDEQYYRPLLKILIKNRTDEKVVLNKGQSIGIITFVRTVSPTLVKMSSGVHNFLFNNNNGK